MKRAVLIVVSGLALVGLLIADIAWPKASTAEEIPAAAPAAQAAATPEAAASSIPTETTAEGACQGTVAEEASAQSMPGSFEDALDQLDEPAAAGSTSAAAASAGEKEGKGEGESQHNDAPAADESDAR
jgi:hypothetical protein